ncbi:anaerobic sulfite reductase subunit AsrA [Halanaerocella petrolearia]
MSYSISTERMDKILTELQSDYKVYAPVRLEGQGRYSDTDVIRYAEIDTVNDIVFDQKSDVSPKEIIHPITQRLFYFTEYEYTESQVYDQDILIFARPCDINGIKRLDNIFLDNGEFEDSYYKRLRDKIKFIMMECKDSWDTCFCVSMNANKTEDYSLAVRFNEDKLSVQIKDNEFKELFSNQVETEFTPEFPTFNQTTVNIPNINEEILEEVHNLEIWEEYDRRCESCGACTSACITCSCFTTSDVTYTENGKVGERRRVWASCLHDDFTDMAGGESFRDSPGERMRYRTLHKIYDYQARFGGEHMCVGCGRCTDRCNELISFSALINRLSSEVDKLNTEV